MRPRVAIIETRPETVDADYGRLLDLAGMASLRAEGPVSVAAGAAADWEPGRSTPPWQLAGVLAWLQAGADADPGHQPRVYPVGRDQSRTERLDPAWESSLARGRGRLAGPDDWEPRPVRVASPLPALTRVAGEATFVPSGLHGRPLLLLPVVDLARGWLVHGAVALLGRLLAPRWRRDRRIPDSEVRAEVAQLAVSLFPRLGVVVDGTVWSVAQGRRAQPVARNVLLAGSDPVAVDAVTLRLAGLDPTRVPWLRLCGERGCGVGDPAAIDIVGNRKLLDLDFAIPEHTFAGHPARATAGGWWRRLSGGLRARRPRAPQPWADLYRDHRDGRAPGADS